MSPLSRRALLGSATAVLAGGRASTRRVTAAGERGPGLDWQTRVDANGREQFVDSARTGGRTVLAGSVTGSDNADERLPLLASVRDDGTIRKTTIDRAGDRTATGITAKRDGGFVVVGVRQFDSEFDVRVYHLDASLAVQREHEFAVDYWGTGLRAWVEEVESGLYAVLVRYVKPQFSQLGYLVAVTDEGTVRWRRKLPAAYALLATSGRIVASGKLLVGVTPTNEKLWSVERAEQATSMVEAGDGGFATAGYDWEPHEMTLTRYEGDGSRRWQRRYPAQPALDWWWDGESTPAFKWFTAEDLVRTVDGGFAVVGRGQKTDEGEREATLLVKIRADGSLAWRAAYSAPDASLRGRTLQQPSRGRYLVAGSTRSGGEWTIDGWVALADASAPRALTPTTTSTPTTTTKRTRQSTPTTASTTTASRNSTRTTVDRGPSALANPLVQALVGVSGVAGGALALRRYLE